MKKTSTTATILSIPKPLDHTNPLYLRKVGKPVQGKQPYLCTDASGHHTAVVFGGSRGVAKSEVWKLFRAPGARFWR